MSQTQTMNSNFEVLAALFGELGEAVGVLPFWPKEGAFTAAAEQEPPSEPRFAPYNLARKAYAAGLLMKLTPLFGRIGLEAKNVPILTLFSTYSGTFAHWTYSRYAKASVKLQCDKRTQSADYLIKWAIQHSTKKGKSSEGRHITIKEHTKRDGDVKILTFKVVQSDVQAWTVVWKDRTFYIRVVKRTKPEQPDGYQNGAQEWNQYDEDDAYDYEDNQNNNDWNQNEQQQPTRINETDIEYVQVECHSSDCAPIMELLEHCKSEMLEIEGKAHKIKITQITSGNVDNSGDTKEISGRSLDTLDLTEEKRATLVNDALQFFDPQVKLWNRTNGSPWRRGYLFYGPPGTGKTSFATALATHLRLEIFTIVVSGMDDEKLIQAFELLPNDGCILLMEDLDSSGMFRDDDAVEDSRERTTVSDPKGKAKDQPDTGAKDSAGAVKSVKARDTPKITVSCLINLLDGVGAKEGRLLIITTNRPKKLDQRILRSGRVSRPFHLFDYSDKETAAITYKRMFGTYPHNPPTGERLERLAKAFGDQCPSHFITASELQEYCGGYRGRPEAAVAGFRDYIQQKRDGIDNPLYDMDDETQREPVFDDIPDAEEIAAALRANSEQDEETDDEQGGEQNGERDWEQQSDQYEIQQPEPWNQTTRSPSVVGSSADFMAAFKHWTRDDEASLSDMVVSPTSSYHTSLDNQQSDDDYDDDDVDQLDDFLGPLADRHTAFANNLARVFRRLSIDELAVLSPRAMSDTSSRASMLVRNERPRPIDWDELEKYDNTEDQSSFWSLRTLAVISGERFMTGYEDWW